MANEPTDTRRPTTNRTTCRDAPPTDTVTDPRPRARSRRRRMSDTVKTYYCSACGKATPHVLREATPRHSPTPTWTCTLCEVKKRLAAKASRQSQERPNIEHDAHRPRVDGMGNRGVAAARKGASEMDFLEAARKRLEVLAHDATNDEWFREQHRLTQEEVRALHNILKRTPPPQRRGVRPTQTDREAPAGRRIPQSPAIRKTAPRGQKSAARRSPQVHELSRPRPTAPAQNQSGSP